MLLYPYNIFANYNIYKYNFQVYLQTCYKYRSHTKFAKFSAAIRKHETVKSSCSEQDDSAINPYSWPRSSDPIRKPKAHPINKLSVNQPAIKADP